MISEIRVDILEYNTKKQQFATIPSIKHHIKNGHCPISLSIEEASALGIRPSQAWFADYCEWSNVVREGSKPPVFKSINSLQQFNKQGRSLVERLRSELGAAAVVKPFRTIYSNIEVETTAPWPKLKDLNYGFLVPFHILPISEQLKRRLMLWRMQRSCGQKLGQNNRNLFFQEGEDLLHQILWELGILFLDSDFQLKSDKESLQTHPDADSYSDTISEVIEGWNRVKRAPNYEIVVGTLLFRRMLEIDPSTGDIFPFVKKTTDTKTQLEKDPNFQRHLRALVQMIDLVIHMLGPDMKLVEEALKDVGKRHMYYGVITQHYFIMGKALVCVLEQLLGTWFTPKVKEAWKRIYTFISNKMMEGYGCRENREPALAKSESKTQIVPQQSYAFRALMQKVEEKHEEIIVCRGGLGEKKGGKISGRDMETMAKLVGKVDRSDQFLKKHPRFNTKSESKFISNAAA